MPRRMMTRGCGILAAVALMAAPASAQATSGAAVTTASAFFNALHDARWANAAAMVDSASAQATRDFQLGILVAWARYRVEFAKEIRQGSGGMVGFSSDGLPRADLIARYGATPMKGFGTARTLAEAAALAPREFLARAFALSDSVFTTEGSHRSPRLARTIVGEVIEADTIAHVLYRATGPTVHSTDTLAVDVIRLRRRGSNWLIDLSIVGNDFLGGIAMSQMTDERTR